MEGVKETIEYFKEDGFVKRKSLQMSEAKLTVAREGGGMEEMTFGDRVQTDIWIFDKGKEHDFLKWAKDRVEEIEKQKKTLEDQMKQVEIYNNTEKIVEQFERLKANLASKKMNTKTIKEQLANLANGVKGMDSYLKLQQQHKVVTEHLEGVMKPDVAKLSDVLNI